MTRNNEVVALVTELGEPAFWGFVDKDACCVNMNFSPCGAKAPGVYATAFYSADQVRALLAAQAKAQSPAGPVPALVG